MKACNTKGILSEMVSNDRRSRRGFGRQGLVIGTKQGLNRAWLIFEPASRFDTSTTSEF